MGLFSSTVANYDEPVGRILLWLSYGSTFKFVRKSEQTFKINTPIPDVMSEATDITVSLLPYGSSQKEPKACCIHSTSERRPISSLSFQADCTRVLLVQDEPRIVARCFPKLRSRSVLRLLMFLLSTRSSASCENCTPSKRVSHLRNAYQFFCHLFSWHAGLFF